MINFILLFVLRWSGVSVIGSYAVTVLTSTKSSINEVFNNEFQKNNNIVFKQIEKSSNIFELDKCYERFLNHSIRQLSSLD